MKKNLIVGQSGGPTAVINGSLYGVLSEALSHNDKIDKVYGMENGIEGFLLDRIIAAEPLKENGTLELIKTTPGSFLGSCRYKLPENDNDPVFDTIFEKLDAMNIGYFLYIGGNDSMDTVARLSRQAEKRGADVKFLGLPKTVDNDLEMTDHTPGFASAARYVAATVREVAVDAAVYDTKKSVTIIEIMGRHAGWLTAASVLARTEYDANPLLIYLPESNFDQDAFLAKLTESFKECNNIIVCISEGIHDANGTFICEYDQSAGVDQFGHKMLSGSGKYLENLVKNKLNVKVRSIELNVPQRCSSAMLSGTDLREAIDSGRFGVNAVLDGVTGKMIAFDRLDTKEYAIAFTPKDVSKICNAEKKFPQEWITDNGCDISDDFLPYVLPLIQGDVAVPMENGLPKFAYRCS